MVIIEKLENTIKMGNEVKMSSHLIWFLVSGLLISFLGFDSIHLLFSVPSRLPQSQ